jgi:hypothetical protein
MSLRPRALPAGFIAPCLPTSATVAAGEREVGEQLGNALVENGAIVEASFVAER